MSESSSYQKSVNHLPKQPLIVASLIVLVSVTLAVGGIVFKTQDSLQQDKIELLADSNQKQVAPLRRVIQLRLAQDKARLVQFAAMRSSLGPGRARSFGDFALISLVSPTSGGQWGLSWIEKGPLYSLLQNSQGTGSMLTPDQEIALLKSLPYDRIREGNIHWQRLSDKSGRPVWALAVSVETQSANQTGTQSANQTGTQSANQTGTQSATGAGLPEGTDYRSARVGTGGRAVVVGFFGRNPLLSATEDFIGSTSSAFVVDSRGYAATHSNKSMVGALLRDDPSVKDLFLARSSAGTTRYTSAQGPRVFSAFEQVDRANLYVVMATPETIAAVSGQSFNRTAVTTGLFALVVGFFLIFAWGTKLLPQAAVLSADAALRIPVTGDPPAASSGPAGVARSARPSYPTIDYYPEKIPTVLPSSGPFADHRSSGVPVATASSDGGVSAAKDRADFIQHFVTGLERGMKEPLLAAMAHVQLAKVKSEDAPTKEMMTEISDHIQSVEKDLRRAKEIIDELAQLSSSSIVPGDSERADLNRIVTALVDHHHAMFGEDGIALKLNSNPVPLIRGREEPLRKAIFEILKNARKALQGRPNKTIQIVIEDLKDSLRLKVIDNGVGMDREARQFAFDPFFRSFEDSEARGLGLAIVRSIVLANGGRVGLSSSIGDGATVEISFPVLTSEREAFDHRPVQVRASEVDAVKMFESSDVTSHTRSAGHTIDFAEEGAHALGGKVPLSPEHASALPPPPRFGADDERAIELLDEITIERTVELSVERTVIDNDSTRDADAEAWSFDPKTANTVKVRPVRRG